MIFHRNSTAGCRGRRVAMGLQRFVFVERIAEQRVDEMQDAGLAAEVARQRQPAGFGHLLAEAEELGRRGAAEAVDRLLEVADEEQPAGVEAVAADRADELDLERIGVLEFVDQEQPQVFAESFAEGGVVGIGDQAVGEDELVGEVELALCVLCGRGRRRRLRGPAATA